MRTASGIEIARKEKMESLGFEFYHTGGGCTARLYMFEDGREFLITDGDSSVPEKADQPIVIGLDYWYDSDENCVEVYDYHEMNNLDEFLEIWS